MEIEKMQALWSDMSDQLEQQKKLTNEIIMSMTQEKFSNKFRTISKYETIGAVICFMVASYILANFAVLDTWYLKACGIFNLTFLLGLPILVLRALRKIQRLNIIDNNYKDTLVSYTKAKTNLLRFQQFAIVASFFLMFALSAVFSKIQSNEDFFMMERNTGSYVVIGIAMVFVIFVSKWGYGHYKRITDSAEELLKGLE